MKVLVDYFTLCSTTRSSFSFDLTSCSVSLRGILLAEYKILYGINVASQAVDDHVQCVLPRPENINTVQDLVLSQENAPQTHRTTHQIDRSSRCCQIFGVCQRTSSYSSRTADLHTVHGTPSSCYDMKPQTSLDQTSIQLTI